MSTIVRCPTCGADVGFELGDSVLRVCPYCRALVARGDRAVEQLGKVAAIADTGSFLALDLRGRLDGVGYRIAGRLQLDHVLGGRWDEWLLRFDDGRWGWLADAQGRYGITFAEPLPAAAPAYASLVAGARLGAWTVVERAQGTLAAADGELPFYATPGEARPFVDLAGPNGAVATLDFGDDPPSFYRGREVQFAELGLPPEVGRRGEERRAKSAGELSCPQCRGAISLQRPDEAQRVGCRFCGALLDATQGTLRFLEAVQLPDPPPLLPPGSRGTLRGVAYLVLGAMERYVESDGVRYPWREYLLYEPKLGYRWLVESSGHFTLAQAVSAGDVAITDTKARHGGRTYKSFQMGEAVVDWVIGEFYWAVSRGEAVLSVDFVDPPRMLSSEKSGDGEINYSLAEHVDGAEVAKGFGVKVPAPKGIGPAQPNPHAGRPRRFLAFVAALFVLAIAVAATREGKTVWQGQSSELCVDRPAPAGLPAPTVDGGSEPPAEPSPSVVLSEPFSLQPRQDVVISARAPVDNSWAYVTGDLINETTGEVQTFDLPIEYYHGVDDGEGWSEGGQRSVTVLPAQSPGSFLLRLECELPPGAAPLPVAVTVENGDFPTGHFLWALGLLSAWLLFLWLRGRSFETRRWVDADFTPSGHLSGGGSDDDD